MDGRTQAPRTADQLRERIDHGTTGEKVDWPDPAASPLGTDDEAGGHAPTGDELRMDAQSSRPATPRRFSFGGVVAYVVIATALLVIFASIVLIG